MANASLQGNVSQEMARRRVTEELLPRQARLNQQYGPPDIPSQVIPYQTFEQPSDNVKGFFDTGYGGAPDASDSVGAPASPATSDGTVGFATALSNAVSDLGPAMAAPFASIAAVAMALSNMNNVDNNAVDAIGPAPGAAATAAADSAAAAAAADADGPAPGSATSAADAASAAASSVAADGPAPGSGDGTGDGGGGGGGGGKIVCTAMNEAYGFGSYRQTIWLDYSAKHLTKAHERGYHRIFRPLVKFAFNSGNGVVKRKVRKFLEWIMRLRTADLKAELRGKNPHPVRRVIRQACEYICYGVGKL